MLRKLRQAGRKALRRLRARPARDGFSLIEIMMVLMILTVGVLPIALIQHRARREVTEADWHTRAIAVAQMQLERLKGQGFGNIAAENGTTDNVTWAAQVTNVQFGLDRVTVTATWRNNADIETLVVSDLVSMR